MTETANDIAEQSRERLLHRIISIIADRGIVELKRPTYIPQGEETCTSSHLRRVERDTNSEIRFHLTADDDGDSFYWTYDDMSFDELYNVCRQLEMQMCSDSPNFVP